MEIFSYEFIDLKSVLDNRENRFMVFRNFFHILNYWNSVSQEIVERFFSFNVPDHKLV